MGTKAPPKPLRKIVAEVLPPADGYARRKVRLECGHEVWCSAAAIYRARCWRCRAEATGVILSPHRYTPE